MNMCQIHFLMNLKHNLTARDVRQFFKLMTLGNFKNHDAFGFFNSTISQKQAGKFKKCKTAELQGDRFIVGHNRLATNGNKADNQNNHPFELNDFVLVHNGVIDNHRKLRQDLGIPKSPKTDSYVILWLIEHFFQKSTASSRQKRIVQAIKKTCATLQGWYSVLLWDRTGYNLYHFKNAGADFTFAMYGRHLLAGTTDEDNLDNIYVTKKYIFDSPCFSKHLRTKAESEAIYLINAENGIRKIAEFKECADDIQGSVLNGYYGMEEQQWIYEQAVADYFTEQVGYCPEIEIDESGNLRIKSDKTILQNLNVLCSESIIKGNWVETHIECLNGIEEYLEGWH